MDYIIDYIDPMLIPIVIALWCIGKGLKEAETIKDAHIPALLAVIAVGLVGLWLCAQGLPVGVGQWLVWLINSIIQGILCAAVAVWGNQLVKQAKKPEDSVTISKAEFDGIAEAMGVSGKELQAVLDACKKTTSL